MKKKFLSLMLAATTIASSTMTIMADELTDISNLGQEVTGSSTVSVPTISVTVPTTADIVINPYQMDYDAEGVKVNSQIISAEQEIVNASDVAVAVNVENLKTTGVSEGISISTVDLTSKNTKKEAFLYLEVIKEAETFSTKYAKKDSIVVIPNATDDGKVKAGEKAAIVTLDAGNVTATKAKFKIGGSVVANPIKEEKEGTVTTKSADAWTESDTIGVSFKFTFTPQVIQHTAPAA